MNEEGRMPQQPSGRAFTCFCSLVFVAQSSCSDSLNVVTAMFSGFF